MSGGSTDAQVCTIILASSLLVPEVADILMCGQEFGPMYSMFQDLIRQTVSPPGQRCSVQARLPIALSANVIDSVLFYLCVWRHTWWNIQGETAEWRHTSKIVTILVPSCSSHPPTEL